MRNMRISLMMLGVIGLTDPQHRPFHALGDSFYVQVEIKQILPTVNLTVIYGSSSFYVVEPARVISIDLEFGFGLTKTVFIMLFNKNKP